MREKWDPKWTRSFPEDSNTHDLIPDIEEFDPICPCPPPEEPPSIDGILSFDFGAFSFRAPYRLTPQGFDAQIANRVIAVNADEPGLIARGLDSGLTALMSAELIPEPLLFLADMEGSKELEARIHRLPDPVSVEHDAFAPMPGRITVIESGALTAYAREEVLKG